MKEETLSCVAAWRAGNAGDDMSLVPAEVS